MKSTTLLRAGAALALLSAAPRAQNPEPDAGLVAVHQAVLDAATDGVVLNVAAHPDDESSRTNTMLRRQHGLRVVTVYSTYGDGGQNAIGKEIGPELARLRVGETLRASAMMGVEVRWLGMRDFGFSKTLDETLSVWGKEQLLAAMRKVVDEVDPDVVITNHDLTHGHGHHRASFWAISEVLKERAAAGAHAAPLYSRCSLEESQVAFDPSELDPVRGETFARIAHRAWTQHVTQGPWGAHDPLQVGKDYWKLVWPEGVARDRAENVLSWVRPRLRDQAPELGGALDGLRLRSPLAPFAALVADLLQQARALQATQPSPWLARRIDALQRALLADAGVRIECWLDRDEVPRGGDGRVAVVVHGMAKVKDLAVSCAGKAAEPVAPRVRNTFFDAMPAVPTGASPQDLGLPNGGATNGSAAPAVPPRPPEPVPGRLTVQFTAATAVGDGPEPQWVQIDVAGAVEVAAATPRGAATTERPTQMVAIELHPRLHYTAVDAIELEWDREAVMVPKGQVVERIVSARVKSRRATETAEPIRLAMGSGIKAEAIPGRIALSAEHPEARVLVRATFAADEFGNEPRLRLEVAGQQASLTIVPVEVFVPPGLRVGLVRGPDDTVERALADLGVGYALLDRDALAVARLEDFTTLLLDMRSYFHVPELAEHKDRILQFCRAGGRVVALYHKPGEWNERAGHPLLAPFPLTVGNDRITEEDARITMLQPEHRLWHQPHAIGVADFEGWVQERGLNFPSKWDPAWTPLLELKDAADEKPSQGALLYTQYGRGDFVYCSLVLYRQLRIGNAGAARLLVNLLAR